MFLKHYQLYRPKVGTFPIPISKLNAQCPGFLVFATDEELSKLDEYFCIKDQLWSRRWINVTPTGDPLVTEKAVTYFFKNMKMVDYNEPWHFS